MRRQAATTLGISAVLEREQGAGNDGALDPAAQVRRAAWLQRRGSLTGNPDDLVRAARLLDAATTEPAHRTRSP